jgi:hypothetical protein
MTKIAIIVGGVVLMAGVALAGTLTSLGSADNSPAGQTISPPAATTNSVTLEDRGQENELRGRENEAGEDLRGPCDEAEHANDPRCTGAAAPRGDDNGEDAGDDHSDPGPGAGDDSSGHGGHGGDDD